MKTSFVTKILICINILLLVAIAFVTSWKLFFNTTAKNNTPESNTTSIASDDSIRTFTGIGRLRTHLKENKEVAVTVIVEPYFPYDSADRAFSEELAMHLQDLRKTTVEYFTGITPKDPLLSNEAAIKKELLKRYNSFLRLGKIKELYFTDFMIIE
jgi:flagellar basal body-associated protein FliL